MKTRTALAIAVILGVGCGLIARGCASPDAAQRCLTSSGFAYLALSQAETPEAVAAGQASLLDALGRCAGDGVGLHLGNVVPDPSVVILLAELLPDEPPERLDLYARIVTAGVMGTPPADPPR